MCLLTLTMISEVGSADLSKIKKFHINNDLLILHAQITVNGQIDFLYHSYDSECIDTKYITGFTVCY